LGLAWVCSSLAVGVLGWLLFAISERRQEALAGWVLLGLAALGVVAVCAVVSNRRRASTLAFSIAAAAQGNTFISDLLLIGGVPVLSGLVSGLLGLRARAMAG
jgi:hypothetical protein